MMPRVLRPFVVALALALLGACAEAPAQAQGSAFTMFMSPEQEKKVGAEEHPKVLARFGGVYDDPEIGAYVAGIGGRLVANAGLGGQEFRFTVLNSPVVNAFALPGGYIYVTRGLIALAGDEAELAGVLAHEIGHVVARHPAERYGRAVTVGLGATALALLLGSDVIGQIAQIGGELYLQSFSREQEFEADSLGVRYLAQTGYAPIAQAHFLASLAEDSALLNRIAGKAGAEREFDLFATHPRTIDRVERAIAEAGVQPASPIFRRDEFLDRIGGLLYGDDPAQGLVRGREFAHPKLMLRFQVPAGFRLVNTDAAVLAPGPDGALIQFDHEDDRAKARSARDPTDYISRVWAPRLDLRGLERIDVNGLEGATAYARVQSRRGPLDARLVAVRFAADTIYRFTFVSPPALTDRLDADFRRTAYSLRRLSAAEAAALKPLRLRVVTARRGDTVEKLAAPLPFEDYKSERFRVLNGLKPGEEPEPGRRLKIVSE
jgi:predicted Zn-dependent protease